MQPSWQQQGGQQGYAYLYNNNPYFILQQSHQRQMMGHGGMPPNKQTEPKPRLAKDEVELLEAEFQKNPKPSSGRKREIATQLNVDHPRINVGVRYRCVIRSMLMVVKNWFQNRRAKEKLLKKSRAASDANNSADDPEEKISEYLPSANDSRPLQASSATFPGSDEEPDLQHEDHMLEQDDDLADDDDDLEHDDSPSGEEDYDIQPKDESVSPMSLPVRVPINAHGDATPQEHRFAVPPSMGQFETHIPSPHADVDAQDQSHVQSFFNFEAGFASETVQASNAYAQFESPVEINSILEPMPSLPSQLLPTVATIHDHNSGGVFDFEQLSVDGFPPAHSSPDLSTASPASGAADLRFKSPPPPANLASRRNKGVPAQLNPTALRSYSYGPKTGIERSQRLDIPSPMRRIASATGTSMPGRIHKPTIGGSAPRSPLHLDRIMRSLQSTGSPLLGSINTALSPATLNDGMFQGFQTQRETTVSSSASDDEHRYVLGGSHNGLLHMEPTLRTPPGTPGIRRNNQEQLPTMDATWNFMQQPDEPLITPGLGSFGSDEFAMAQSAPEYVMNSQPPTPSFAPTVGSNFFQLGLDSSVAGLATEYAFSGDFAQDSARSSPGQFRAKQPQFQFTPNITPQDFSTTDNK